MTAYYASDLLDSIRIFRDYTADLRDSTWILWTGLTHLRWIFWISDDFSRAAPARNRPTA